MQILIAEKLFKEVAPNVKILSASVHYCEQSFCGKALFSQWKTLPFRIMFYLIFWRLCMYYFYWESKWLWVIGLHGAPHSPAHSGIRAQTWGEDGDPPAKLDVSRLASVSLHTRCYVGKLICSCKGAWARAIAQVAHFHQHPEHWIGSLPCLHVP